MAEFEPYVVGRFLIEPGMMPGRIWLSNIDVGDGGDFPADEVRSVLACQNRELRLEEYFQRNF